MEDISEAFLTPHLPSISDERKDSILNSLDFYSMSFYHGVLVMTFGLVFTFSSILQIASMEVTTTDSPTISDLKTNEILLSIILSILAAALIKSLRSIEKISSHVGSKRFEKLHSSHLHSSAVAVFYSFVSLFSIAFIFALSEIFSNTRVSLGSAIGQGKIMEFALVLFLYLLLAGTVGTLVSSIMMLRYETILYTLGLRTWLRRLIFYAFLRLRPASPDLKEALQGRCPQCCSNKYESYYTGSEDREFICSLCGLHASVESMTELTTEISETSTQDQIDDVVGD